MKHWSFYDPTTGRFLGSGGSFKDESMMQANTPDGMAAIEGRYDHEAQRIDMATGSIVDYQPPQPSADHEWDEEAKRWALSRTAQDRSRLLGDLDALDKKQGRALREAILAVLPDGPERVRLAALDAEAAELRTQLSGKAQAAASTAVAEVSTLAVPVANG